MGLADRKFDLVPAAIRRSWLCRAVLCVAVAGLMCAGCGSVTEGKPLPNENTDPLPAEGYELVAHLAHITDSHLIDEETPARLPFAKGLVPAAWRAYERYSCQLLDGIIRAINRRHVLRYPVDFVVHTGDAVDNRQGNELRWFLEVMDGVAVDPTSGPDDRAPDRRGEPHLDAHLPFKPQGLYRQGVHGDLPSIPWYILPGNHDSFALGIFPVTPDLLGGTHAPLPLAHRVGLFLPTALDPTSTLAYAPITPAQPGLPLAPTFPTQITPNAEREYFSRQGFVTAQFGTSAGAQGHGFVSPNDPRTWYSVTPVPGLRLIALDTTKPTLVLPTGVYSEGAIDSRQMAFLSRELADAQANGELVIVLTHHPSYNLRYLNGSSVETEEFRSTLNSYPCVVAHLTGHEHRHRVWDHGGYVEFETASTLDYPQEGRFVEVWRRGDDVQLRYEVFSHLPDVDDIAASAAAGLGDDPLLEMRLIAFELAAADPVVPGLAPADELLAGIVDPIRDAIEGISTEIGDLGEEIVDIGEQITETAGEVIGQVRKSSPAARARAAQSGTPHDRTGVIQLHRR